MLVIPAVSVSIRQHEDNEEKYTDSPTVLKKMYSFVFEKHNKDCFGRKKRVLKILFPDKNFS